MNETKKQHGNKQNQDDKKADQGQHNQHSQQDKEKGTHQPSR